GIATEEDHDLMELSRHSLHAMALLIAYPNESDALLLEAGLPGDFIPWIQKNFPDVSVEALLLKIDTLIKDFFQVGQNP
ncbi:MAG: hypothetical protein KC478_10620, partial [Bacteriovoracaceae bacterium]|nr:hypothetical protein [Bacteriovoracaceae bacterium]